MAARCIRPRSGCCQGPILEQLASQARETLAQLKTDGVVGDDVMLQVATSNGWDDAIDAAEWLDGELLAIGSRRLAGLPDCLG